MSRIPIDLVLGYALGRTRRFALAPRLALDMIDVATTSIAEGDTYTSAARLGLPLALEAGVREGWAGFVVPCLNLAVTSFVRRKHGLPTKWATVGWQFLAVFGGIAIRAHLAHERSIARVNHDGVIAARATQARLSGQSSVAAGADTAVDILIRTAPILERAGSQRVALNTVLSTWKEELASKVTAEATYLRTALLMWRRRRTMQPDLSLDVDFDISSDNGLILLSAGQVSELERLLDGLGVRGLVEVRVHKGEDALVVGSRRELSIGGHRLVLEADSQSSVAPTDLGAAALFLGATLCAIPALPTQGHIPIRRVALAVAWFVGGGLWARNRVNTGDVAVHDRVFLMCGAGCLLHALMLPAPAAPSVDNEGWVRQNYMWPIFAEIPLAYLYRREMNPAAQVCGAAMTLAAVAFGYRSSRSSVKDFLYSAAPWTIAAFTMFRGISEAVAAESASYRVELATADDVLVASASDCGRMQVIDLIREAYVQLRRLQRECDANLSEADRDEVQRRLGAWVRTRQ